MINFPNITPVALTILGMPIRWYSLAYIIGITIALFLIYNQNRSFFDKKNMLEDLFFFGALGIIIGGRLGYILIYNFHAIRYDYLIFFKIWNGGMSFHGGIVGLVVSIYYYCRKYQVDFLTLADKICIFAPIGLMLGRLANFANQELYGRPTNIPWAMIFPAVDNIPRHPSQLYEAFGEGIILFLLLFCTRKFFQRYPGAISGLFLILYGIIRSFLEQYRELDSDWGFIIYHLTMGQFLSIPMILLGVFILGKIIFRRS